MYVARIYRRIMELSLSICWAHMCLRFGQNFVYIFLGLYFNCCH
jgi:hypothetical protein